jgi:hypothetical protein
MIKILSLPLWWRVKSDGEYVDVIRRFLRSGKRAAAVCGTVSILCLVSALWVGNSILRSFAGGHGFTAMEVTPGIALGLLVGGISGFLITAAVLEGGLALSFVFGYRTEKLLVKYYDLASSPKSNDRPPDNPPQSPSSPVPDNSV